MTPSSTFPILPTEGKAFANAMAREPDPLDVAEKWIEAGATIRAIGWAIMSSRSADLTPQERTDARAAVRTITEQLDWMEGRT